MNITNSLHNNPAIGIKFSNKTDNSLSRMQKCSLITRLQLLLDEIVSVQTFPLNMEDALTICNELLHISKSDQWLQYKKSIFNQLIEMNVRERKYFQENNELQNNCLTLYKNCQDLEERLENRFLRSRHLEKQPQLNQHAIYEHKHLTKLRQQKTSLIQDMQALANNKKAFLTSGSNEEFVESNLDKDSLISTTDLINELNKYESLLELKEKAFEKLKMNFHFTIEQMDVEVDDIHSLSIKYNELVKQDTSEIVRLKSRVFELQQQIEQSTRTTTIIPTKLYHTIDSTLKYDEPKYTSTIEEQNAYNLIEELKFFLKRILDVNKSFLDSETPIQLKSIDNNYVHEKYISNKCRSFTTEKSVQTESNLTKSKPIVDQFKNEVFNLDHRDLYLFRKSMKNATYGKEMKLQEDWDKMVDSLKIAQKAEEVLKRELELKTMELNHLNQIFMKQNEHLQKLEKFSMALELKRQESIENIKKSFQVEINSMKEELNFYRSEMKQQDQLIRTLQQAQHSNKQLLNETETKNEKYSHLGKIEDRKETRKNLEILQKIKSGSATDDHLNVLNKILKTEYNRKADYSSRDVPKQKGPLSYTSERYGYAFEKYSDRCKELVHSKIGLKSDSKSTKILKINNGNEPSNLIDDYKKFMQKSGKTTRKFQPPLTTKESR